MIIKIKANRCHGTRVLQKDEEIEVSGEEGKRLLEAGYGEEVKPAKAPETKPPAK